MRNKDYILPIMYGAGVGLFAIEDLRWLFNLTTPLVLMMLNIYVVLRANTDKKINLYLLTLIIFGFLVEAIGVSTGLLFGSYDYGNNIGPKLLDVPIIIAFNWAVVVASGIAISNTFLRSLNLGIKYLPLLSIVTVVAFDYIMEPATVTLGYWAWEGGIIPITNYVTWGAFTLCATLLYMKMRLNFHSRENFRSASLNFLYQTIFFLAIQIVG